MLQLNDIGKLIRKMKRLFGINYRTAVIMHDLTMILVAWFGAYWLRFNLGVVPANHLSHALQALAPVMSAQAIAEYRRYRRHFLPDPWVVNMGS